MTSKRIIALIAIFAILSSFFVTPVGAATTTDVVNVVNAADALCNLADRAGGSLIAARNYLWSLVADDICPSTTDTDGNHEFVKKNVSVDGVPTLMWVCEYCGKRAGEVFSGTTAEDGTTTNGAYQDYVETLPVQEYASDNTLIWKPRFDSPYWGCYVGSELAFYVSYYAYDRTSLSSSYVYFSNMPYSLNGYSFSWGDDGRSVHITQTSLTTDDVDSTRDYLGLTAGNSVIAPMDGTYSIVDSYSAVVVYINSDNVRVGYGVKWSETAPCVCLEGETFKFTGNSSLSAYSSLYHFPDNSTFYDIDCLAYLPTIKITPTSSTLTQTLYDQSTRMGNVNFDYGVTNTDNSITTTNNYIVNETTNTYTNPVTGASDVITDWTYDYGDRSYNLTLEGGDTTTVTYGDEYVTINEYTTNENGDTITNNYTVYYVITTTSDNGGDDGSGSDSASGSGSGSSSGSGTTTGSSSRVFQNYGAQITQSYGVDGHGGTDCIPTSGTADTVIAHSEGDVVWVQTGQENNQGSTGDASYGNAVKIKHSNGYYTLYAHLATVEVSEGDHVYKGQALGQMGNTGNSYGAHLHFEVRDDTDTRINSDPYINADLPGLSTEDVSWWSNAMSRLGQILSDNFVVEIFSSIGEAFGALWGWLPPEIVTVFTIGVTFLVVAAVMKFFL